MAGYNGFSMSNNAVAAYSNGEKPLSKWTKSDILAEIPEDLREKAKALTVSELKTLFLVQTSWHHTSSMYNRTNFYSVRSDVDSETIDRIIADRTPRQSEQKRPLQKALVHYLVWEGTRKHPKATEHTSYALLNDGWAFLPDGSKKKRTANGFYVIEVYTRAPKGTADLFKAMERRA